MRERHKDIIAEIEATTGDAVTFAALVGVATAQVDYWIALAQLRRDQQVVAEQDCS